MKKTMFYCYDSYCGWCYGFTPVMKRISEEYAEKFEFEVLSGGMIINEQVRPVSTIAPYIKSAYKKVEELSGIKFGEDFLWHINNPEESDWEMNSEKPAIALCIFKEYYPDRQIEFAGDLQRALNYEGRDLDDDRAYVHLLEKYSIQPEVFFKKLAMEEYKEQAYHEFALCEQLKVTGFPAVLLQLEESKFHLLANGYTSHQTLKQRIDHLSEQ